MRCPSCSRTGAMPIGSRRRARKQADPAFPRRRGTQHSLAQELRGARRLHPRRPAAHARLSRLRQPARVHDLGARQFRARRIRRHGSVLCRRRCAQPHDDGFLRGRSPFVADGLYSAGRSRPRSAHRQTRDRTGRQGLDDPLALSARPFAQPYRLRSALGVGAGGGPADPVPCRWRGETQSRLFRERPAR